MKMLVLDVNCTPTITTINYILIADSAATGDYISITTPHSNRQVVTYPIYIRLPDGITMKSTHTCNMMLPILPPEAWKAHIFQIPQQVCSYQFASYMIMVAPLISTKTRSQFVAMGWSYSMAITIITIVCGSYIT